MSELQVKVHQLFGYDWIEHRPVLVDGGFGWEHRKHSLRKNEQGEWYREVGPWHPPLCVVGFDMPSRPTTFRRRLAAWLRWIAAAVAPEGCRG